MHRFEPGRNFGVDFLVSEMLKCEAPMIVGEYPYVVPPVALIPVWPVLPHKAQGNLNSRWIPRRWFCVCGQGPSNGQSPVL